MPPNVVPGVRLPWNVPGSLVPKGSAVRVRASIGHTGARYATAATRSSTPGDPRLRCGAAYSGAQEPTPPTRSTVMRTTKPGDEWRIGGNLTPGPR